MSLHSGEGREHVKARFLSFIIYWMQASLYAHPFRTSGASLASSMPYAREMRVEHVFGMKPGHLGKPLPIAST